MVAGGHAWLRGGMHGWGLCMVVGSEWFLGGMRGCRGVCMVGGVVVGGMHGCGGGHVCGGHAWLGGMHSGGCAWDMTRYGQ